MRSDDSGHEDIMKEAVLLLKRVELKCVSFDEPVVLGFNAQGWLFVYLGNDPMYRFDELGRLRRAFVDGFLFRTSGSTLAVLERSRNEPRGATTDGAESVLLRRDLSPSELQAFRERAMKELAMIRDGLPAAEITRQHPEIRGSLRQEFVAGLDVVLGSTEFLAPAIVRR